MIISSAGLNLFNHVIFCVQKPYHKMPFCKWILFCKLVESLFGSNACTPNMHLHGHLHECYKDYGPGNSFWLFAFERLNGILGSVATNHQAIETQLMLKFRTTQQVFQFLNDFVDEEIKEIFKTTGIAKGSLKYDQLCELPFMERLSLPTVKRYSEVCKLVSPIRETCLVSEELSDINRRMESCFAEFYHKTLLLHEYSNSAFFLNELFGSSGTHSANSSIMVYVRTRTNDSETRRPGIVR